MALLVAEGDGATTTPIGRASVNEKPVNDVSAGAVNRIVRVDVPPTPIVDGENDFEALVIPVPSAYTVTFPEIAVMLVAP